MKEEESKKPVRKHVKKLAINLQKKVEEIKEKKELEK
tara:strand:- start:324 stop:434 length:111 start_codon:yes stop_codon:yes gene_type:complete